MARKSGFSLIEMVIVTAIVTMIAAVVSVFLTRSLSSYRISRQSVILEENAAAAMREFERAARAATEINTANATELNFLRYENLSSQAPVQVRYFIEGNSFKVGITNPSGVYPDIAYPAENEEIDLIIENLTNTDNMFRYFGGDNAELTGTINCASVRLVELTISLDKNGNLPPGPITQITKVNLRNMKDNL